MSHIATCSHCSRRIQVPDWNIHKPLICPHCLAEVGNHQPGAQIQAPNINTDVKRDLNIGNIVLAVLIGFFVLGFLASIPSHNAKSETLGVVGGYFCLFSLAAVAVVLIIGGIRLLRSGRSGARVPAIDQALGCVLLVLGTIASFVIFIFFACATMAYHGEFHG
ncbi:MAG: hypothetical protein ACRELG_29895 [Gemmataceae bacterium]